MKATTFTKPTTRTNPTTRSKGTALTQLTTSSKRWTLAILTKPTTRTKPMKRKIDWMALWVYGFLFSGFVSIVYGVAQIYVKSPF